MAQNFDYNDPQTTNEAQADIDQIKKNFVALVSAHEGSSAPSGNNIKNGALWLDTSGTYDRLKIRSGGGFNATDKQIWPSTGGVTNVSSNTTTSDERYITVDVSGGTVTITLSSNDAYDGNIITIKDDQNGDASSNNITVNTEGSQKIDGSTSITMSTNDAHRTLVNDGTNWHIISTN